MGIEVYKHDLPDTHVVPIPCKHASLYKYYHGYFSISRFFPIFFINKFLMPWNILIRSIHDQTALRWRFPDFSRFFLLAVSLFLSSLLSWPLIGSAQDYPWMTCCWLLARQSCGGEEPPHLRSHQQLLQLRKTSWWSWRSDLVRLRALRLGRRGMRNQSFQRWRDRGQLVHQSRRMWGWLGGLWLDNSVWWVC